MFFYNNDITHTDHSLTRNFKRFAYINKALVEIHIILFLFFFRFATSDESYTPSGTLLRNEETNNRKQCYFVLFLLCIKQTGLLQTLNTSYFH